jgi:glucose dehydrogenase
VFRPRAAAACRVTQVAPLVAGGRIFVLDRSTNGVAAFDAATGAELWRYHDEYLRAVRLAVWEGAVVVVDRPCDRAADPAGKHFYLGDAKGMRAVDAATGRAIRRTSDGAVRAYAP